MPRVKVVHKGLSGTLLAERYKLVHLVGQGGMGTVYEALDQAEHKRVAVKVLHGPLGEDLVQLKRFEREVGAANKLGHPHVVQVLDCGREAEGRAFYVMEYIEGRSIEEVVRQEGSLDAIRAVRIALQVLSALEVAHRFGIVHRDIKTTNIMLEKRGDREIAKVIDFGIAKMMEGTGYTRLTATGIVLGTPTFMAPEQALGKEVGPYTDVYAVGVVMFTLLAGEPPFRARSVQEYVERALNRPPKSIREVRPDLDPELARIIDCATNTRHEDRYANAGAMHCVLAEWIAHGGKGQPSARQRGAAFKSTIVAEKDQPLQHAATVRDLDEPAANAELSPRRPSGTHVKATRPLPQRDTPTPKEAQSKSGAGASDSNPAAAQATNGSSRAADARPAGDNARTPSSTPQEAPAPTPAATGKPEEPSESLLRDAQQSGERSKRRGPVRRATRAIAAPIIAMLALATGFFAVRMVIQSVRGHGPSPWEAMGIAAPKAADDEVATRPGHPEAAGQTPRSTEGQSPQAAER